MDKVTTEGNIQQWGTLGRSWVAVTGLGYLLVQGPVDGTDYDGRRKGWFGSGEGWLRGVNPRESIGFRICWTLDEAGETQSPSGLARVQPFCLTERFQVPMIRN